MQSGKGLRKSMDRGGCGGCAAYHSDVVNQGSITISTGQRVAGCMHCTHMTAPAYGRYLNKFELLFFSARGGEEEEGGQSPQCLLPLPLRLSLLQRNLGVNDE